MKTILSLRANKPLAALFLIAAAYGVPSVAIAQGNAEYRAAYECAMESFSDEYSSGPAAFCVGNSRDPSSTEEKAYADAEKAFKAKGKTDEACTFSYAVWVAGGSRADDWLEGPQRVNSLNEAAELLSGRRMAFYDSKGKQIANQTVAKLFAQKGDDIVVSDFAKKSCSPKQIGK